MRQCMSEKNTYALYRNVARLFVVGFQGFTAEREVRALIDDGIGGLILFGRNVESAPQVAALIKSLKAYARRPLLLAVDQEGGPIARLRCPPFTALPAMRKLGAKENSSLAYRTGRLLAFELRAVGFDCDYAPVLDVDTNAQNPIIGSRAFHQEAAVVARLGVALAQGLEDGGVASCGKHFPGHGDTDRDSHLELPRLAHGLQRLHAVEFQPFAAYARAGLASVMTAHILLAKLDARVPATMSRKLVSGILKEQLHFSGVVVSDDLEMRAISKHFSVPQAAVEGLKAGVDQFLVCHQLEVQRLAIEGVVKAIECGEVNAARFNDATARVDALMRSFVRGPEEDGLASLNTPEHKRQALALSECVIC